MRQLKWLTLFCLLPVTMVLAQTAEEKGLAIAQRAYSIDIPLQDQ